MFSLRSMNRADWPRVANLIYLSTNVWYESNRGHSIFSGGPEVCELFPQVYEDLDPECGIVAEHKTSGMLIGSCFYHPRETHVSLGIMNVHPNYFGAGVASAILRFIIDFADQRDLPVRLVSSAMNLDSFSLYTRYGFAPFAVYQDMTIPVPKKGLEVPEDVSLDRVREADLEDVSGMGAVEFEIAGISRERDYCYFMENDLEIWRTLVSTDESGEIDGFLVSVDHPGSRMIGPGVAKSAEVAEALLFAQLDHFRGKSPVFLVPVNRPDLVSRLYATGAKNCEIHFGQVLGDAQPIRGIVMPTFMPETG
ncbi:MAG: GNAT family N-acetyltransferase [Verrucomicrobiales bacterium]|nr:GNAT family N-acetyltransferase [Verrucomicrobiales bacterium]